MSFIDSVARLLATENLTILRDAVKTASFNLKTRALTIPNWVNMTEATEQLMAIHEVGHAKFTPLSMFERDDVQKIKHMKQYVNILEDARIERYMRVEYPGVRKVMIEGYNDLNTRDFFGVKGKSADVLNKMILINKMNLYYKLGYSFGIEFTDEEQVFVDRCDRAETEEDIVQLAKDILAWETQQNSQDQQPDNSDLETIEKLTQTQSNGKLGNMDADEINELLDDALAATTEDAFKEMLENTADVLTKIVYKTLDLRYSDDIIVPFKTVLKETEVSKVGLNDYEAQQFRRNSDGIVGHLIKEFEMRKTAEMQKRATTSRTGMLDVRKIFSYQIKDDLFKRVTTLPQGKNHGMVFLVDWSGSMQGTIHNTLCQVLNLVSFCRRMQIPFQVLAFTTSYGAKTSAPDKPKGGLETEETRFRLLELMSSDMTNIEFNTMYARMYKTHNLVAIRKYGLGGTPLNHSLMYMIHHLPIFQGAHRVEKQSLVVLTDGEGSQIGWSDNDSYYAPSTLSAKRQKVIIRDPVTKKEYPIPEGSAQQAREIIKMIQDRTGASVIGFHLCGRGDIQGACQTHAGMRNQPNAVADASNRFASDGYCEVKEAPHDAMFLVDASKIKVKNVSAADSIVSTDTAETISHLMKTNISASFKSRILLTKFIETIA